MTAVVEMTKTEFTIFINKLAEGIAHDLEQELAKVCPVDTGDLRQSIRVARSGHAFVIYMLDYALHLEFGTAPHIIRPRDAKALHWKMGGKHFFAKMVRHPGTRPQPFIRTTIRTKLPEIIERNARRLLGL